MVQHHDNIRQKAGTMLPNYKTYNSVGPRLFLLVGARRKCGNGVHLKSRTGGTIYSAVVAALTSYGELDPRGRGQYFVDRSAQQAGGERAGSGSPLRKR